MIAAALSEPGGKTAMGIRLAENYIQRFEDIIKKSKIAVYPDKLADLAVLSDVIKNSGKETPKVKGGADV